MNACEQNYDYWMIDCRIDWFAYCQESIKEFAKCFEAGNFKKYKLFNFMYRIW